MDQEEVLKSQTCNLGLANLDLKDQLRCVSTERDDLRRNQLDNSLARLNERRAYSEHVAKLEERVKDLEAKITFSNLTNLQHVKVQRRTLVEAHSKNESLLRYIRHRCHVDLEEVRKGHAQHGQELVKAAGDNNIREANWLRQTGADLEARSSQRGNTALIEAAAEGNVSMVHMLLMAGADTMAENRHGLTARNVAIKRRQFRVAECLLDWDTRGSSASPNSSEEGPNQEGEHLKTRNHS